MEVSWFQNCKNGTRARAPTSKGFERSVQKSVVTDRRFAASTWPLLYVVGNNCCWEHAVFHTVCLLRQLRNTTYARPLSIMLPKTWAFAASNSTSTLRPATAPSTAPQALQSRPFCTGSGRQWCFQDRRLVQLRPRTRRFSATTASQSPCLDSPGGLPLTAHLRSVSYNDSRGIGQSGLNSHQ